jgi:hypothetical protein
MLVERGADGRVFCFHVPGLDPSHSSGVGKTGGHDICPDPSFDRVSYQQSTVWLSPNLRW